MVDRSSVVYSKDYDITQNALILLYIIAGFMFANDETLIYHSTMHCGENSSIVAITVAEKEYIMIDKIFSSDTLRGHVTQYWHVQRNGVAYVITDL